MTLEQIATILTNRIKELQDIKSLTLADGGSEQQLSLIEEKILSTSATLSNILDSINEDM